MEFEWDERKNRQNFEKHDISFEMAMIAFSDPHRVITKDIKHSSYDEDRFFCFGKTDEGIITVRFTVRNNKIRIFGAGKWREGKSRYEKENTIQ